MPTALSPKGWLLRSLLGIGVLWAPSSPLLAQDATPPYQIRWYQPFVVAAGVSVLFLVDNPVRSYMLDNQTATKDDVASAFKRVGQPEVWALVPTVMMGTGLALQKPGLTRSGLRAVTSAVLAGGVTAALKWTFGRERPIEPGSEPLDFEPFSMSTDDASMPSGHTATAFGLMASLAEDVHPLWAKIGLYAVATGTAWSRLYNNEHWTSDVVAGAVVGITSAKLVSGKWQVWGIRPPSVFTNGHQVTVSWQGTF